jgi:hypothetical protein
MSDNLVSVLDEAWAGVTEIMLELMAPPRTWLLHDTEDGVLLVMGDKLAPICFRSLSQASAIQGVLTYAKLAYDANQTN